MLMIVTVISSQTRKCWLYLHQSKNHCLISNTWSSFVVVTQFLNKCKFYPPESLLTAAVKNEYRTRLLNEIFCFISQSAMRRFQRQTVLKGSNAMTWWTSLVAETVKRLLTMQETRVRSLGQEDALEKDMAPHSSTLAWKIHKTKKFAHFTETSQFSKLRRRFRVIQLPSVPCSHIPYLIFICLFLILNFIYKYGSFPELILSHFYHFCIWCKIISNLFVLLIPFSDVISQIKKSFW